MIQGTQIKRMELSTDAMDNGGFFDARYTCELDNSSPELRWENVPENVAGYALIVEDPDAQGKIFAHWLVYHIPGNLKHLPAGIPPQDILPNGIRQGLNSFNKLGYAGPCPPLGDKPHIYIFRLYALRETPQLPSRLTRDALIDAISPYVISTAELVGRYQRGSAAEQRGTRAG